MNSLDFIKKRLEVSGLNINDLNHCSVIKTTDFLDKFIIDIPYFDCHFGENEHIKLTINYIPDADFEYFTQSHIIHDNSQPYPVKAIENCLNNILQIKTYDLCKYPPKANGHVTYTIGDLVSITEYSDSFATPDHPHNTIRTTICLPLIYEYTED